MTHCVPTEEERKALFTQAHFTAMTAEEQLTILKNSKFGTWYDDWQPYCMTCSTFERMDNKPYGFECAHCGNQIGYDLSRLQESPLNDKDYVIKPVDAVMELARRLGYL